MTDAARAHQIVMDAISQFDGVLDDPEGPSVEEQMFLAIENAIAAALTEERENALLDISIKPQGDKSMDWHIWYSRHTEPMKDCPRCANLTRAENGKPND